MNYEYMEIRELLQQRADLPDRGLLRFVERLEKKLKTKEMK